MRAAFGIGANLGDRLAALQHAVDVVLAEPATGSLLVSSVFETAPVGGPEQPDYLNAVIVFDTSLSPGELLALAQRAETDLGRTREVRWGARTLDVDVLAVGDLVSDDERLLLPHPRAHERAFVLVPWAQVDPTAVLPGRGSVGELAAGIDASGVRSRDDLRLSAVVD